jgi:SAM-dependent methyltransferase
MSEPNHAIDTTVAEAYERYMVPGMFLHWTQMLVKLAAPKPGEQVLDVACGTGVGARLAAPAVGGTGRVVGLDVDAGVIEYARRLDATGAHPIEWHCASALDMPFESATFDLCLCLQGLQFFPDRVAGLKEMRRVLKPSGRLVASIWGPLASNKGHHVLVQALEHGGVDASAAKRACSFASGDDIRQAAAEGGFTEINLRSQDGVSQFASIDAFLDGMTNGSPSTRHAVALLPENARGKFFDEVREGLAPYVVKGVLAYPMRTHILVARAT